MASVVTTWRDGDWRVDCEHSGGRLGRIAWRGRDLLTGPHLPGGVFFPPDPRWGQYETRPVYGYDDCWPSLETSSWPGRGTAVRDHGELCWLPWSVVVQQASLLASVADPEGEWLFSRTLSCDDGALRFDFTCRNTGDRPLCMGWAGHALVPPGAVVGLCLPNCEAVRQEYPSVAPAQNRAPTTAGAVWPWLSSLSPGEAVMLVLPNCHSPALTIALDGLRWRLTIEEVPGPSLGLWYNRGGYPPEPGPSRDEFGVEWMLTAECLLKQAVQNGSAITLSPEQELHWTVIWSIEETS